MLFTDLKQVANESLFNPKKPTQEQKILLDVGNPQYWTTKAMELLMEATSMKEGSDAYHGNLKRAVSLIILTRAKLNEKDPKNKKTRKRTTRSDSKDVSS